MFWHIVISIPFLILTPWNHEWWNQSLFCLMIFCRYITNILSVHLLQFYSVLPLFQMSGYATDSKQRKRIISVALRVFSTLSSFCKQCHSLWAFSRLQNDEKKENSGVSYKTRWLQLRHQNRFTRTGASWRSEIKLEKSNTIVNLLWRILNLHCFLNVLKIVSSALPRRRF